MQTRYNWYLGQLVGEADLDALEDAIESTEYAIVQAAGMHQQAQTATPGPTEFGGIRSGLRVTWDAANTCLNVSGGMAIDNQGRLITVPAATVKITNTGTTTVGDSTDATGNGALITSSCASGDRIVASLFLVYDELSSDTRTDAASTTLYYQQDASFKFDIQIGTSFSDPPTSTPTRSALSDGKVLLADMVLTNNAGTMEVVSGGICVEDQDWINLGGNYANLTGRRSDWMALDQGSDYPRNAEQGISYREGKARAMLRQLIQDLQRETSGGSRPAGAEIVSAPAVVGNNTFNSYAPLNLSAGSTASPLSDLLDHLNRKLSRGGDTLKPQAGHDGVILDPEDMDYPESLANIKAYLPATGSSPALHIGKKYGHVAMPNRIVDHFLYRNDTAGPAWSGGDRWGPLALSGSGGVYMAPVNAGDPSTGGIVAIETSGAVGDMMSLKLGYDPTTTYTSIWFPLASAPWALFSVRFLVKTVTDIRFFFGFSDSTGNEFATVNFDSSSANKLQTAIQGNAVSDTEDLLTGPPTTDTWYTVRIAITSVTQAVAQLNNGTAIPLDISSGGGGFTASAFYFHAVVEDKSAGGAIKRLFIDQVEVGELLLQSDMY